MQKIISAAALLLSLAGASAPAFAEYKVGGTANDYYGARGKTPPQYVHAQKWELCARLYPTFNPRTGTFVGPDGITHPCQ
jgi:BA14K-like protein